MTEPTKINQKILNQAADVLHEIKQQKDIGPKQLEIRWKKACNFVAKAGVFVEGTDIADKSGNPKKLAAAALKEIEALSKSDSAKKTQTHSDELSEIMAKGIRATIVESTNSEQKRR